MGTLTTAITKKLEVAFKKEETELYKLSAFVPVCKSMLDLGPAWLDKFVREILMESLAVALELAIVAGTGKEQPRYDKEPFRSSYRRCVPRQNCKSNNRSKTSNARQKKSWRH